MTLVQLRTQIYALLRESSGDSNFTDSQLNSFINQAQALVCPMLEYPRKTDSGTQVTQGMGDITLPTDDLLILDVYYGDISVANDVKKLIVTTEQNLSEIHPSWLESLASSQGRPAFFFVRNKTTGNIYPRADSANSVTGKKVFFTYVFMPPDLVNDSDTLPFPEPYNNILKFYVTHLCYLNMGNKETSGLMLAEFDQHHQKIQSSSTKEAREAFGLKWGYDEFNNDDTLQIIP